MPQCLHAHTQEVSKTPIQTAHKPWWRRFYGNSGYAGGGLFQTSVNGDVTECSFEDNVAANSGGGVAQSQGSGDITYSVFVNNQVRTRV